MSIQMQCPGCQKKLRVADEHAGKNVRCPQCGTVQRVPEDGVLEAEASPSAEARDEPYASRKPQRETDGYDLSPAAKPAAADERREPCPACGEMILAHAVKCRYCGEIFDETLKRKEKRRKKGDDSDLTAAEWLVAVLCSGIGCIIGIVWMIQGKPKGTKMFGVSLLFVILWNVIRFAIVAAGK